MKVKSYHESKLNNATNVLGGFFDFAINDLNIDGDTIFDYFINSSIAEEFENGNGKYIYGRSGIELVYDVLSEFNYIDQYKKPILASNTSKEYWAGQALAYLQWETSRSFRDISEQVSYKEILDMYNPYHEMDIRKFVDDIENNYFNKITNLRMFRKRHKLTQQELADKAYVSKRSIEMYEQRKNDINKAQAITIYNFSKILNCNMADLLE